MGDVNRLFSNPSSNPSVAPSLGPSPLVQSMIAASVARSRAQQAEGAQERPEKGRLDKRGAALTPRRKRWGGKRRSVRGGSVGRFGMSRPRFFGLKRGAGLPSAVAVGQGLRWRRWACISAQRGADLGNLRL